MSSRRADGSYRTYCDSVMCSSVIKQLTLVLLYLTCSCYSLVVPSGRAVDQLAYNNQFAVHIPNATEVLVELIAEKHGFRSLGQVNTCSRLVM